MSRSCIAHERDEECIKIFNEKPERKRPLRRHFVCMGI
jgi:hypothetical protein